LGVLDESSSAQSLAGTIHEQSELEQSELEAMVLPLLTDNPVVRSAGRLLCSPDLLCGHTHSDIDTYFGSMQRSNEF
jgi:hypothetical protein